MSDATHHSAGHPAAPPSAPRGTDGVAIAALVASLLALGPVAIVLGVVALRRTRRSGTPGRGLAVAGVVIGSLGTVVLLVLVIAWLALLPTQQVAEPSPPLPPPEPSPAAPPEPTGPATEPAPTPTPSEPAVVLSEVLPLEVGEFTARGLSQDTAVLDAGALEAYLVDYATEQDDVLLAVSTWPSRTEAQRWAAGLTEQYPAEDLQDSGDTVSERAVRVDRYWVYATGEDLTIIWTHGTAALSLHGPAAAVQALYQAYPL